MPRNRRYWWPLGHPVPPYDIAGHGEIRHDVLRRTRRMIELVDGQVPQEWGLLFIRDTRGRQWTFMSPDPHYVRLLASQEVIELPMETLVRKLPIWHKGWST